MKLRVYYNKADHTIDFAARLLTSYSAAGYIIKTPFGSPRAKALLPALLVKAYEKGKRLPSTIIHETEKNTFLFGGDVL